MTHPVATSLASIQRELSSFYLERRNMLEAQILGLLAKQHVFALGSPGTGKSAVTVDLCNRFPGSTYFESLLSRTRPEAAVLGPYDLPGLRDRGDFHRKINGFLTTANLAFLDEIGKMSPTLGHDLLAILNERVYHEVNGGRSMKHVPLYTAFTASNELIADESDDAAALWDRLLVRVLVESIQDNSNFAKLLASAVAAPHGAPAPQVTTIPWDDVADVVDNVVPTILLPGNILDNMIDLKNQLRQHEVYPSDRRWRQSIRVLQATAFMAGRVAVEEDDLYSLRYTLWDSPEHISTVERITLGISNPTAEKMLEILDKAETISAGVTQRRGQALEARAQYGAEVITKVKMLMADLGKLRQDSIASGRSTTKLDEAAERVDHVKRQIYVECLDMPADRVK